MTEPLSTRLSRRLAARSGRRVSEGGFILIPVLMVIALLSLVALTMSQGARQDIRVAALNKHRAEAQALADGLAVLTIRRVVNGKSHGPNDQALKTDGTPLECLVGGSAATITVHDAAGLVDLNTSTRDQLERLLTGVGVDIDRASRLAAAIIDFRDYDDVTLPGGAETAEYLAAGRGYGPKNAPFETVDELEQVLGMTPELMTKIRPLITVHSQNDSVDLEAASEAVRNLGLSSTLGAKSRGIAFVIRAAVDRTGGARFVREAIIGVSSRSSAGYVIRQWTSAGPDLREGIGSSGLPPCIDLLL